MRLDTFPGNDPAEDLRPARRPDAAGRALSARFDGAELEGEARLLGKVHRLVEDNHAAMADHPLACRECLVVEGGIKERRGKIRAERPADLDGPDRPPSAGAAADVV